MRALWRVILPGLACALSVRAQGPTGNHWQSPPQPVVALSSTSSDLSISVCLGGTQAWITSLRGRGSYDIYWSTRTSSLAAWSVPVVSALSTPAAEWFADISEDGTELFFASAPSAQSPSDLMHATRTNVQQDFASTAAVALTALNTASDESDPSLSADGLSLWFYSDRAGTQHGGIFRSTRASRAAAFGSPALALDTPNPDFWPSISRSDNYLCFAQQLGPNDSEYFSAYRPDAATPFGTAVRVVEWGSPDWEAGGHLARCDSEFWLASDHIAWGGLASDSIYLSKRRVPGLAADRDAVPSATGGTVTLCAAEDAALVSVHVLLLAFRQVPALAVPGITGELVLDPTRLFVLASGSGTDGIVTFPLPVPAGLPSGGRLHFQVLRVDVVTSALALSLHESVGIN